MYSIRQTVDYNIIMMAGVFNGIKIVLIEDSVGYFVNSDNHFEGTFQLR